MSGASKTWSEAEKTEGNEARERSMVNDVAEFWVESVMADVINVSALRGIRDGTAFR